MAMLDGFLTCAPLSATCVFDWSAIATSLAAFVALFVGVLPIVRARKDLSHQAKFVGQVVAGGLALQELNLRVVAELGVREKHMINHWVDEAMGRLLAQVDAGEALQLLPYVKVLPDDVSASLVKCIGMLQSCERTVSTRTKTAPYEVRRVLGECAWFEGLASCIEDLRLRLSAWTGAEDDDVLDHVSAATDSVLDEANDELARFQRQNPPSSARV